MLVWLTEHPPFSHALADRRIKDYTTLCGLTSTKFSHGTDSTTTTSKKHVIYAKNVYSVLQDALRAALESTGQQWTINEGDGAFYGPKIDICVFDALKRRFQCATVQVGTDMAGSYLLRFVSDLLPTADRKK